MKIYELALIFEPSKKSQDMPIPRITFTQKEKQKKQKIFTQASCEAPTKEFHKEFKKLIRKLLTKEESTRILNIEISVANKWEVIDNLLSAAQKIKNLHEERNYLGCLLVLATIDKIANSYIGPSTGDKKLEDLWLRKLQPLLLSIYINDTCGLREGKRICPNITVNFEKLFELIQFLEEQIILQNQTSASSSSSHPIQASANSASSSLSAATLSNEEASLSEAPEHVRERGHGSPRSSQPPLDYQAFEEARARREVLLNGAKENTLPPKRNGIQRNAFTSQEKINEQTALLNEENERLQKQRDSLNAEYEKNSAQLDHLKEDLSVLEQRLPNIREFDIPLMNTSTTSFSLTELKAYLSNLTEWVSHAQSHLIMLQSADKQQTTGCHEEAQKELTALEEAVGKSSTTSSHDEELNKIQQEVRDQKENFDVLTSDFEKIQLFRQGILGLKIHSIQGKKAKLAVLHQEKKTLFTHLYNEANGIKELADDLPKNPLLTEQPDSLSLVKISEEIDNLNNSIEALEKFIQQAEKNGGILHASAKNLIELIAIAKEVHSLFSPDETFDAVLDEVPQALSLYIQEPIDYKKLSKAKEEIELNESYAHEQLAKRFKAYCAKAREELLGLPQEAHMPLLSDQLTKDLELNLAPLNRLQAIENATTSEYEKLKKWKEEFNNLKNLCLHKKIDLLLDHIGKADELHFPDLENLSQQLNFLSEQNPVNEGEITKIENTINKLSSEINHLFAPAVQAKKTLYSTLTNLIDDQKKLIASLVKEINLFQIDPPSHNNDRIYWNQYCNWRDKLTSLQRNFQETCSTENSYENIVEREKKITALRTEIDTLKQTLRSCISEKSSEKFTAPKLFELLNTQREQERKQLEQQRLAEAGANSSINKTVVDSTSPSAPQETNATILLRVILSSTQAYLSHHEEKGKGFWHGEKGVKKVAALQNRAQEEMAIDDDISNFLAGCELLKSFYNDKFKETIDASSNMSGGTSRPSNHSYISFLAEELKNQDQLVTALKDMAGNKAELEIDKNSDYTSSDRDRHRQLKNDRKKFCAFFKNMKIENMPTRALPK